MTYLALRVVSRSVLASSVSYASAERLEVRGPLVLKFASFFEFGSFFLYLSVHVFFLVGVQGAWPNS